jgi:hypothetical protein
MLILFLGAGTVWKWAVLPTFQRNITAFFIVIIMETVFSSEMSVTQPTSTRCQRPKADALLDGL